MSHLGHPASKGTKRATPQTLGLLACRYFRAYLHHVPPGQDVDISVHCECEVFAWLLAYAEGRRHELTAGEVLPILIASNFLQVC